MRPLLVIGQAKSTLPVALNPLPAYSAAHNRIPETHEMKIKLFHRSALLVLFAFVLMSATNCDQKTRTEKVAVANEMIDAFSQGCGMGPWTQAALARASQISSIYQSLLNKQGCTGNPNVQRALGAAQALESELQALRGASAQSQARQWEETSNDLLIQINQTSDPTLRSTLIGQYGTARFNLSQTRSEANYIFNPGYKERMVYGTEAINARLRDLMSASNSLADCYANNPSVAMQLGASLAELGGSFAPPMIGLGVSAVSNLLKVAVQYSVMAPSARAVYEATATKMPMALTCGLEALTRDYCKAKDARGLLEFSLRKNDGKTMPFFFGTDLQDRYMPSLYSWLDQVVNGSSKIRSPIHAEILNMQFRRLSGAQISLRAAQGSFSELRAKVSRDPNSEATYVRTMIRTLVTLFYTTTGSGFPTAVDPSVFSGFEDAESFVGEIAPHGKPSGSFTYLDQLLNALEINRGDFDTVEAKFNALFKRRFELVMADFNEKVQISAPSTVREATRRNLEGLSPIISWQRMYQFLEQYAYEQGAPGQADRTIINEFVSKIDPIYKQLNDPASVSESCTSTQNEDPAQPRPPCIPPATMVLSNAHNAFKLDNNNVYLPKMVSDLVRTDLVNRACRGETPKEIKELLRIGGTDLILLLQRAGISSPAAVKSDISTAQTISLSSLEQFRKFYLKAIGLVMRDLKEMADRNREPRAGSENAPVRDQLSKLCILTYISGMGQDDFDYNEFCSDAKIVSAGNVTISFRELVRSLRGKALDQRICSYEIFLRVDRLKNQNISATMCSNNDPFHRFLSLRPIAGFSEHGTPLALTPESSAFWQNVLYSH